MRSLAKSVRPVHLDIGHHLIQSQLFEFCVCPPLLKVTKQTTSLQLGKEATVSTRHVTFGMQAV